MTWDQTLQRIASDASKLKPAKVALTLLTAPLYVLGMILGLIWSALVLAYAAVAVGIDTGRRARPSSPAQDE